jgi:CBS domain-containing protein
MEVIMATTVSEVMTRNPETVEVSDPVVEAARRMRDADAGDVIVLDNGRVVGILTDRDIAIRVVAENKDPSTPVAEACSTTDLQTVGPDTSLDQAVQLMRSNAVRRLPVVENDRAVGIISLGDLAIERDEDSALADISAAAPDD